MEGVEITLTIKSNSMYDLQSYIMADEHYDILFELKHNFWRKWKHADGSEDYIKGINEVLEQLREELRGYEFNGR